MTASRGLEHLRTEVLDRLERPDLLAELLADLGVVDGRLQAPAGDSGGLGGGEGDKGTTDQVARLGRPDRHGAVAAGQVDAQLGLRAAQRDEAVGAQHEPGAGQVARQAGAVHHGDGGALADLGGGRDAARRLRSTAADRAPARRRTPRAPPPGRGRTRRHRRTTRAARSWPRPSRRMPSRCPRTSRRRRCPRREQLRVRPATPPTRAGCARARRAPRRSRSTCHSSQTRTCSNSTRVEPCRTCPRT